MIQQPWTEQVENNVITTFGSEDSENFAVTVRCASYSIQLSVTDSMKTTKIRSILTKSRKVVKKLRASNMRLLLQKENGKKPIKDSKIRWNSQFNMLFRLVENKAFCLKYENVTPELKLSDVMWNDVKDLLEALKPIKIFTRQVQAVQMTLSDFYGHYVKCRLQLSKNTTNEFAQLLAKSMNMRQSFFSNNILLSAVYLDPRYRVLLTQEDRKNAQKHLAFLYKKIHDTDDNSQSDAVPVTEEEDVVPGADHEVEFESFLKHMDRQTNARFNVGRHTRINDGESDAQLNTTINSTKNSKKTIFLDEIPEFIKSFNEVPRMTFGKRETISTFWKSQSLLQPELFELSNIVYAVPATQVTVERSFSTLDFVFTKKRGRTKAAILEKQMFVCLNRKFQDD